MAVYSYTPYFERVRIAPENSQRMWLYTYPPTGYCTYGTALCTHRQAYALKSHVFESGQCVCHCHPRPNARVIFGQRAFWLKA